jgi:hypothetical protein
MHVLSRPEHLTPPHAFRMLLWAWVRFRGWPGPPTSSIVLWVGRPPRVPDPAYCRASRICLAIWPVLAMRLPDRARPSGWDGLTRA